MKRDDPTYLRSVNAMLAAEASPERAALVARKQTAMRPVADLAEWPQPLDLRDMAESPLQRPQFLIADWLPAGYATLLAGHGGVGKSAIGLHMAVCVAMGLPFCGMPTERRRVTYLSCEDRDDVLHWRLAHICNYLGIGIADLHGWLHCIDLVGCDSILWARNPRTGNTITPAFGFLDAHIERYLPEVLFVDGIADTFGGNENAWAEIKAFVNQLLAMVTLDGALVLLGHVAKPTATNSATGEGLLGLNVVAQRRAGAMVLIPRDRAGRRKHRANATHRQADAGVAEVEFGQDRPDADVRVGRRRPHVPAQQHLRRQPHRPQAPRRYRAKRPRADADDLLSGEHHRPGCRSRPAHRLQRVGEKARISRIP